MTEEEWLAATDPQSLLKFLEHSFKHRERKYRLFAVACCRHYWDRVTDQRSRKAIEVAERFADDFVGESELALAFGTSKDASIALSHSSTKSQPDPWRVAQAAHSTCDPYILRYSGSTGGNRWVARLLAARSKARRSPQVRAIRCIFGNPLRPVTFNPAWRTSTVTNLGQAIYDDRHLPSGLFDNQRLAILADALEEAGCDNADILGHLRAGGDHARGCWAVDLVLGKV